MELSGQFVEVGDDVELYVERRGAGPTVVLVHGLFGLVEHWEPQLPVLAERFDVIAYDLRGSGRSTKPPDEVYPIERHAEDLRDLLEALEVRDDVVVVGHSMGGCVALEFALRNGDRVAGLGLISSFSCGEHCGVDYDAMKESVSRKRSLVDLFLSVSFSPAFTATPEGGRTARWNALEAAKLPLEAVYAAARGMTAYDARDRLDRISAPALVIVGEEDWSCPLDPSSRYLADHLSPSSLHVLACRHFPTLEQPEQTTQLIGDFAARVLEAGTSPDSSDGAATS